jgi:mono/diheme cytochrome c family protein
MNENRIANLLIFGFVLALGVNIGMPRQQLTAQSAAPSAPASVAPASAGASESSGTATPAPASSAGEPDAAALLRRYCQGCHNQRLKTGGLMLDTMSLEQAGDAAHAWEKVAKRLRAGSMPPAGLPRPERPTVERLIASVEHALDKAAATMEFPRTPAVHRLNRTEYANAIRDLLALEVDGRDLLPPDDADLGFDNMADILTVSPTLLDRAIIAARKISRLAVGDPAMTPATDTHVVPPMRFQDDRMDEDLPFGSRGGTAIRYYFPLDAEYAVKLRLQRQLYAYIRGLQDPQQLEVRLDGKLIKSFTVGGHVPGTPAPASFAGDIESDRAWEDYTLHFDDNMEVRFHADAGPRVLGIAFVQGRSERDGVLQPRPTTKLLSLSQNWSSPSGAPEAALESVVVSGPYKASGPGDTPSRRRIFTCQPASPQKEEACAREILSRLATRAFRRPVTAADTDAVLAFYRDGRKGATFETGIQRGIERILVDPEFMFRVERDPAGVTPGAAYRVGDIDLASRLSFFLWSSVPDDELLDAARRGQLEDPAVLETQTHRMLADSRASALVSNFAVQWLSLRKLRSVRPTPELYPEFDENLREAFEQETTRFIEDQLRRDASVLDLLRSKETFVNERLAQHYGIEGISGSRFRKVTLPDATRGGLLGQGSILTITSYPNRTSPVLRGHWLLENVLGTPPPPPPPNVPGLPDRGEGGRPASVRERLEMHRKNPVCASCHAPMDPLGFALEHFDGIGMWRDRGEGGAPIDASGVFPGGAHFEGLPGLLRELDGHDYEFVATVTEKLLTYALGRGLEPRDMASLRKILRDAAANDYRWSSIILGIVRSEPFQMRRAQS